VRLFGLEVEADATAAEKQPGLRINHMRHGALNCCEICTPAYSFYSQCIQMGLHTRRRVVSSDEGIEVTISYLWPSDSFIIDSGDAGSCIWLACKKDL
jgi:hypothetical protein